MIVKVKKENTVRIVGAINTVSSSECDHSYLGKYILSHSGEKCNRNRTKCVISRCTRFSKKANIIPEVSYFDQ